MLSCLFPPLPAQPQFYPQVRIKTAGTANAGHKFSHRAYCSGRGRCPAPRSPGENLRVPETSRAPCVLRSPGPRKAATRIGGFGCVLERENRNLSLGQLVLPFLLVQGLYVPWWFWGWGIGELFAFSDTLIVLVPTCPVKDFCMSCVSVPVWEGWSDCLGLSRRHLRY